jgi:hypothetical protein
MMEVSLFDESDSDIVAAFKAVESREDPKALRIDMSRLDIP